MTATAQTSTRRRGPSRWERARVGILGAGVVGILAEALLLHRTTAR